MLTHGNLLVEPRAGPGAARAAAPAADDVLLGVLPLFHIFGLNVVLGLALHAGVDGRCSIERFDPASALEAIARPRRHRRRRRADDVGGVGERCPTPARRRFATVRLAASGAARLPAEVAERMREPLRASRSTEGYGLTEASPVVTSSRGRRRTGRARSARRCPASRSGWSTPTATTCSSATPARSGCGARTCSRATGTTPRRPHAALTADGWLRTGDVAVVDDDGYLYLVDRAKDLIIVSGFNVFPAEVEEVLLEHPAIEAVRGRRRAAPALGRGGEGLRRGRATGASIEEDEVIDFCADRLARYKCPSKVMFVDELPQGIGRQGPPPGAALSAALDTDRRRAPRGASAWLRRRSRGVSRKPAKTTVMPTARVSANAVHLVDRRELSRPPRAEHERAERR